MRIECDACRDPSSAPSDDAWAARTVRFGDRSARLCDAHAEIAERIESTTYAHLIRYFSTTEGRRTHVRRRGPSRPNPGRRLSDRRG